MILIKYVLIISSIVAFGSILNITINSIIEEYREEED